MAELSFNLQQALAARSGRSVAWLLEVYWWDGTRRYSDAGWSSRTRGFYLPFVEAWGELRQASLDNAASVQDVTFSATIADMDGDLQARLGQGQPLYQTSCSWFLAGGDDLLPNVSDWYTAFAGYLDGMPSSGRGLRELQFRGLNVFSQPVRQRTVDVHDFPNADPGSIGLTIPRAWGRLEGVGFPGSKVGGACPAYLVDTVGFRYLVAEGWVDVLCVYKDGSAIDFIPTGSTGFSIVHVNAGASSFTLIDFLTTQGTSLITCDVRGYDTNGDGTGTLIEGPLDVADDVLKKTLSPTGASILDVSNSSSVPSPRMHAASGYWLGGAAKTGVQIASDVGRSYGLYPWIKGSGLIAFGSELSWEGESSNTEANQWVRAQHDQAGADLDGAKAESGAPIQQHNSGIDIFAKQALTYAIRPTSGQLTLIAGDALARAGSVAVDQQTAPFLPVQAELELDAMGYTGTPNTGVGLISWWEARTLTNAEHNENLTTGASPTVRNELSDLSTFGRDWSPSPSLGSATFLRGETPTGLPAIKLASSAIDGPNSGGPGLFGSAGSNTLFMVLKINSISGAGADGTVTNETIFDVSGTGVFQLTLSTLNGNLTFRFVDAGATRTCMFKYGALGRYVIVCAMFVGAGGGAFVGVNEIRKANMGTSVSAGNLTGLAAGLTTIGSRVGHTAFSDITVAAFALFQNQALNEAQRRQVYQGLESRFLRYPTAGVARATASLRELSRRNLRNRVTIDADLSILNVPLLGGINVQDPDVPDGFPGVDGDQPWERRPHIIAERTIHPSENRVSIVAADGLEQAVCLWISARSDQASSGDRDRYPGLAVYPNVVIESFLPRPATGAPFAFTTLLESPWSDQFVLPTKLGRLPLGGPFVIPQGGISSATAQPLVIPAGLWLQAQHFNDQNRSSLSNATPLTGLTISGGGITADPNDLLFDPSAGTTNSAKLVVTGGADQIIQWPGGGLRAATPFYLSVDWKGDSGQGMLINIGDPAAGKDYDPSTGLFSATPLGNLYFSMEAWQGHAASRRRGRFFVRCPATSGVGSLTKQVKLPSSAGAGAIAHVYHMNVQTFTGAGYIGGGCAGFGSRIINDALSVPVLDRGAPAGSQQAGIRIYNGASGGTQQIWPTGRGTMLATVVLLWNAADISVDHPLVDVPYDGQTGNHYFRVVLELNGGNPRVAFRVKGGSEVVAAVSLAGFAAGDVVRIAARWTSHTGGELGLPADTYSVFVKRMGNYDPSGAQAVAALPAVKGTDVTGTKPTASATAIHLGGKLNSGSDANMLGADVILIDFLVVARCMPDGEIDKRA